MTETLRGQVESIRVIRDGWGKLELLTGSARERTTVTGHPLGIEVGDTIEVDGAWSSHPRYGRQFRADAMRTVAPSDASGAIEWILSRLPAVGRKRATAMVERWGLPGLWQVLEERPHELTAITGITPAGAERIGEAYRRHLGERDRIVALRGYGLSDRQAAKVCAKWGADALEKLREDPYLLALEIDGFGFLRSDAVALKMGLPRDHPSRIRAGLAHLLSEARTAGHCYVPAGKLIAMTARLLGVPEGAVRREANRALDDGRIVLRVGRAYEPELDEAEQDVADAVRRMLRRMLRGCGEGGERSEAA